jgi:hypothetical protein
LHPDNRSGWYYFFDFSFPSVINVKLPAFLSQKINCIATLIILIFAVAKIVNPAL